MASDRDAVQIALIGTSLIGDGCNTKDLYTHPKFVEKMVDYIIYDFGKGRTALDPSIRAIIVCDSSE